MVRRARTMSPFALRSSSGGVPGVPAASPLARAAFKANALDFLEKPISTDKLLLTVDNALDASEEAGILPDVVVTLDETAVSNLWKLMTPE